MKRLPHRQTPKKIPHYSCPKHDFYVLKRGTLRGVSVGYVSCQHCTYVTTMTHRTLQSKGIRRSAA